MNAPRSIFDVYGDLAQRDRNMRAAGDELIRNWHALSPQEKRRRRKRIDDQQFDVSADADEQGISISDYLRGR